MKSVHEEKGRSRFQKICRGAYPEYDGQNFCANSMSMALIETVEFLTTKVSERKEDWAYGKLHV